MTYVIEMFTMLNQWYWIGFATVLVMFEILLGVNFFMLWLGIVAAGVGIILAVYPQMTWEFQFILFALGAVASTVLWSSRLKKRVESSDKPYLNRRSEQYIGRKITLKEPIINGRGRAHIDDSIWRVEGPDEVPKGTIVEVIGVIGVVLQVDVLRI